LRLATDLGLQEVDILVQGRRPDHPGPPRVS